jgi:hypothetical protein
LQIVSPLALSFSLAQLLFFPGRITMALLEAASEASSQKRRFAAVAEEPVRDTEAPKVASSSFNVALFCSSLMFDMTTAGPEGKNRRIPQKGTLHPRHAPL